MGRILVVVVLSMVKTAAFAQCVNPIKPNCNFYAQCLEKYCSCGWTSSGYALSYGKKYCDRFLSASTFSARGTAWRDSTLICLQESLVPLVPIDNPNKCDCNQIRQSALDSHVQCYTKLPNSICTLKPADLAIIDQVVDASDKYDTDGLIGLKNVLVTCMSQDPSFPAKALVAKISNLLN